MLKKKRFLVMVSLVLLLVFSLVFTAAAAQVTGTVTINGKKVPVNIIQVGEGKQPVYRIEVPWQDFWGNKKITIYYTISLKQFYPGTSPAPQKPAPEPEQPAPEPEQPEPEQPAPEPEPSILTAEEMQMFNLVNQERAKMGLKALKIHEGLVKLARLKSKDMIDLGYFAHQYPTYGSPFDMMRSAGISYSYAGENLAGASTVSRAHTSLMNSPGHRANILNANYTHVGIGIVNGGPYGKMFTQMFIGVK